MSNNVKTPFNPSACDPNGLLPWENDELGISEAARNIPRYYPTKEELEADRRYCVDLMPNGKTMFDNDLDGVPEADRYKPASS